MSMRALVINSSEDDCAKLVANLQESGYEAIAVQSLQQVRSAMQSNTFDLLLLDTRLPNGNGLHFCNEVRDSYSAEIVIIFVAECASPTDRVIALDLGADDFVPKPWDTEELLARIAAHMRR
jgi:DNA-binding response OmpR family regulator